MEPVVTTYRCSECGREDRDFGRNPPAPVALICWNCGAGRLKVMDGRGERLATPYEQKEAGVGMMVVSDEEIN